MRFWRYSGLKAAGTALLLASSCMPAFAHPHVFVDARMEIVGDKSGHLKEIRNIWSFDELFSASVIPDFDKNADGRLEKSELAAVGAQVRKSIAEWSYYTFVRDGAKDIALADPSPFDVTYDAKKGRLLFVFTMKPKRPIDLTKRKITFSNYDDSYFVAFDFPDESRFIEKDLPKSCKKQFVVPSPDEAATRWMDSVASFGVDQTLPADGVNFSQVLATRLELDCR